MTGDRDRNGGEYFSKGKRAHVACDKKNWCVTNINMRNRVRMISGLGRLKLVEFPQ